MKSLQLAIEGFQLGMLFVFFNGIQENYKNGYRGAGVLNRYGFRKNLYCCVMCPAIFIVCEKGLEVYRKKE